MATLETQNLKKSYGAVEVIPGIDLKIRSGEFLVLVGPSGSGKSTLLKIIAGLEDVTSGTILVDGEDITDVDPSARDLAMVFQTYALYPHMTVAENMSFALRMRKEDKAEIDRRVKEAIEILELTGLEKRKPGQLSGGQRQRVAMGRCIVRNPKLFLFDEPLSNLDAKLRAQTRIEIRRLHERLAATSIFVTHDQIEAMTMADRIALLDKGELQQIGTPQELYLHPRNRFVASFLGSPEMNFFTGTLRMEDGGLALDGAHKIRLDATAEVMARLESVRDPVEVGVRPEHLERVEPSDPGAIALDVEVVEWLGHEAYLVCRCGEKEVVVRGSVDGREGETLAKAGERLHVRLVRGLWHVFDGHTGENLLAPAAASAP